MKRLLTLLIALLFATSLAGSLVACSGSQAKPDAMPSDEDGDDEDDEDGDDEEASMAPKAEEAAPRKTLQKFEGNRMERTEDE